MKRLFIYIFLFIVVFNAISEKKIRFKHLGIEDGLSQISIRAIYQDENGAIWIGTNEDIKRYNGNSFDEVDIRLDDNNPDEYLVSNITGDKSGHLFFVTYLNHVIEYDLKTETSKIIFDLAAYNEQVIISSGRDNLWITKNNQIFKLKNDKLEFYYALNNPSCKISAITELRSGNLLIGTRNDGVIALDGKKIEMPTLNNTSEVVSIYEDSKNRIWIGTYTNGIFLINKNNPIQNVRVNVSNESISSNFVRTFCEDNNGNIWIGSSKGLDRYNPTTHKIDNFGISKHKYEGLSHPSVWSLFKDKQGTIWVATFYGGINYFNPEKNVFRFKDFSDYVENDYPIISRIVEDKRNNLWVGTEGKGLFCFDHNDNIDRNFKKGSKSLSSNTIKSMYYESDNDVLWLGTHLGGLNRLNLQNNSFSIISINSKNEPTADQSVQSIVPYQNYLYISTLNGIYKCDKSTLKISQDEELKGKFTVVKDLAIDDQDNLWIATRGLYSFNLKTKQLRSLKDVINYSIGSYSTLINRLLIDSNKRIWLGTSGSGVIIFDPKTETTTEFNVQNSGLESNYISSLLPMTSDKMLIGTSKGVSVIDTKQQKSFNYDSKNGFPLFSLMNGDIYRRKNSEIVFGGINGICFFDDKMLANIKSNFNVRFDNIWVNNKLIRPNDGSGILKEAVNYNSKIVLNHKQSMVFIEVATNNYLQKDQPNFQFKLENFNENWVYFDIKKPIRFMNLSPGKYNLRVRNNILGKPDQKDEISIEIIVKSPWYSTWLAYVVYLILGGLIIFWLVRFYRSRLLLQNSLLLERQKAEQKELANQSKLRFFTNISHEFRTPITLITSQLELLLYKTKKSTNIYKDIQHIYNSTHKITSLINELLDFRKQDQGFMTLKVSNKNIVSFVSGIYEDFIEYAKIKEIDFQFKSENESIDIYFDNIQLQKVFNNLISNAFKFTSKKGTVTVEITDFPDSVAISVSDNGIGITEKSISKVFDRFYQDDTDSNSVSNTGTGIGLALSKGIVDLHLGTIQVKSELNKGSVFTVILKKGDSHFLNNEKVKITDTVTQLENTDIKPYELEEYSIVVEENIPQSQNNKDLSSVLIVEDDEDLRSVLVRIFSPMYKTYEAENGKTGFSMAKEILPDLIISDIMMPYVTGDEMCNKIKNDFDTCHIPVILLTAQTTEEQNLSGLKSGADDYITKPFNVKLLLMRCNNLLMGRKILMEKYTKEVDTSPKNIVYNNFDKQFIEKAVQIIENNLSDKKIDIDFLCSEMAIGRRVFFSKMKSITGQTPNDFILSVKFKVAASMLKNNPELNVSEISDMLGFSSAKYFGKCFKEQFGVSPTQMRENLNQSGD